MSTRPLHTLLTAVRHPRLAALAAALLAAFSVAGVLYFLAAVSVSQELRPMYDPVQRTISELAIGRDGFIQVSAFVVLGLSLVALPYGLRGRLRATLASRLGRALLLVCGVSSFVAAAFPTDLRTALVTTITGQVHAVSASLGYFCLICAMLLLTWHFRRDAAWHALRLPSAVLTLAGVAALIALGISGEGSVTGLLQRLMAVTLLSWVALTAVHACRLSLAVRAVHVYARDPRSDAS
jgi:hypothetical protein